MHHILIVDDDPHIRDVISFALDNAGYRTSVATDGAEAIDNTLRLDPDLLVLDIGLPECDGLEVCRRIRKQTDVPILFLSARDDEIDRILGLELGGDDYVTKPFSPRELVARVGVILKRVKSERTSDAVAPLTHGGVLLDPEHRSVCFDDRPIPLTAIEFNILQAVLRRPRLTFTREQILAAAYPPNMHVSDRTIDSHVRNIRAKFTDYGCGSVIETVHAVGFRLGPCRSAAA